MTKIINRGCNHCGGDLEYEEGDYKTSRWKCIQCDRTGEVSIDDSVEEIVTAIATVAAIVKPEKRVATRPKKGGHNSKYYNRYMEEILSDRLSIGHLAMLNKWGISTTNWSHIKPRWISAGIDIPDMRSKANMAKTPKVAIPTSVPDLPDMLDMPDMVLYWRGYHQAILDISKKKI